MDLKLGCLPGYIPVGLKDLTYYSAGNLPQPPASVAVPSVPAQPDGTAWGMDGNDTYGDCGVAGVNHLFMADESVTGEAGQSPAASDIVNYYLTYTKGQDTGVVLADFLGYVKQQGFFGHTIKAYAPVGVHDIPTLHFAVDAYDAAYTGISVTSGMQRSYADGKPWDLDDVLFSGIVGGHCVPVVGYDSHWLYAITWGRIQPISYAAWHYMSSEAWAVISGEFAAKGDDGRGVNLAALEADLSKLAA